MPALTQQDFPNIPLNELFANLLRQFSSHGTKHSTSLYTMTNATVNHQHVEDAGGDHGHIDYHDVWIDGAGNLVVVAVRYYWDRGFGIILHGTADLLRESFARRSL